MNSYCKKSLLAVKMVHLVQCKHNVFKTQSRQFVLSIPAGKMTSGALLALYLLDEGEYSFHTFYPNCHTIICDMTVRLFLITHLFLLYKKGHLKTSTQKRDFQPTQRVIATIAPPRQVLIAVALPPLRQMVNEPPKRISNREK